MTKPTDEGSQISCEQFDEWLNTMIHTQIVDDNKFNMQRFIRERLLATQWRDIKDAPRDGTKILAYGLQGWDSDYKNYNGKIVPQVVYWIKAEPYISKGYWKVDTCSYYVETLKPTHWMPLPKPPEGK